MILQTLTIALKSSYSQPGPTNPYQAKLSISYNDTAMQVALSDETCRRILALAADEIATAAQVQISDFVRQALTVATTPMIEGSAL
jgi:hypothetical protein